MQEWNSRVISSWSNIIQVRLYGPELDTSRDESGATPHKLCHNWCVQNAKCAKLQGERNAPHTKPCSVAV